MGRLGATGGDGDRKAGRRDSWKMVKGWLTGSPSPIKERRDITTSQSQSHSISHSHKTDGRVVKRRSERTERSDRSRSKKRHALPRSSDDSDSGTPRNKTATTATVTALHSPPKVVAAVQESVFERLGNFGHWLEAHPRLPTVLSYYLQFAVNSALGFCFLYLVYCAWSGIQSDVEIESNKHAAEVMVELSACALDYKRNHCGTANMAPALENLCGVWETCMKRDPKKVARASVTAKTFAMIFNSFVEEFSYKSMVSSGVYIALVAYIVSAPLLTPTSPPRSSQPSSSSAASTSPTGPLASSANPHTTTHSNISNHNNNPKTNTCHKHPTAHSPPATNNHNLTHPTPPNHPTPNPGTFSRSTPSSSSNNTTNPTPQAAQAANTHAIQACGSSSPRRRFLRPRCCMRRLCLRVRCRRCVRMMRLVRVLVLLGVGGRCENGCCVDSWLVVSTIFSVDFCWSFFSFFLGRVPALGARGWAGWLGWLGWFG